MGEDTSDSLVEVVKKWQQGDCVVSEGGFIHRLDPERRLALEGGDDGDDLGDVCETRVAGFMVVTQTCDIVRDPSKRPYIEVAPLVKLDLESFRQSRAGRRPQFAFVPGLESQRLVADLDRVMTVDKAVLAKWGRVNGARTPSESRALQHAIGRKRLRVAFPNDFVAFVKPLEDRLTEKHGKQSPEGDALRALREVRVRAAPSWDALEVEIVFYFIRDDQDELSPSGDRWDTHLDRWLRFLKAEGRFQSFHGLVQTLDDLTARDYVESDVLDLDHLSHRE